MINHCIKIIKTIKYWGMDVCLLIGAKFESVTHISDFDLLVNIFVKLPCTQEKLDLLVTRILWYPKIMSLFELTGIKHFSVLLLKEDMPILPCVFYTFS